VFIDNVLESLAWGFPAIGGVFDLKPFFPFHVSVHELCHLTYWKFSKIEINFESFIGESGDFADSGVVKLDERHRDGINNRFVLTNKKQRKSPQ
jgi:hypothetical protein